MPNITHLKSLMIDDLFDFKGTSMAIADIGCADGALAFFMERLGHRVDAYDFGPTNMNGMRDFRDTLDFVRSLPAPSSCRTATAPIWSSFRLPIFWILPSPIMIRRITGVSRYEAYTDAPNVPAGTALDLRR